MPVRIVTDSACDLPEPICEELGIEVVPLTIRFGDREFVDRKELSVDAFWRELEASSVLPETVGAVGRCVRGDVPAPERRAAPTAIVCINLSARLSATMQSAQVAAKALDGETPIEIIDSLSASMGIGNLVAARRAPRAATARRSRRSSREVEDRREREHVFAALDTLEYLRKGGRIGGAQAMLGSMLSIKPIISVIDGAVESAGPRAHPLEGAAVPRRPDPGRQGRDRSACCTRTRPTSTSSSRCSNPRCPTPR